MFNFEIGCNEMIYNVCDDFFSEELSKREIAKMVIFTINELQSLEFSYNPEEFHFYYDKADFKYFSETKSEYSNNFFKNINAFTIIINDMSDDIFDYYHIKKESCCPDYWSNLNSLAVALLRFVRRNFLMN